MDNNLKNAIAQGRKPTYFKNIKDAIAFAARGHGTPPQPSRATLHVIEEEATLRHWLQRKIQLPVLLDEARRHAEMASRFASALDEEELEPRDRDEIAAAYEGALLQHVLVLAQIALSQDDVDTDLVLGAAHASVARRPPAQAAVLIAIATGQHLRAMIAANPY